MIRLKLSYPYISLFSSTKLIHSIVFILWSLLSVRITVEQRDHQLFCQNITAIYNNLVNPQMSTKAEQNRLPLFCRFYSVQFQKESLHLS